MEHTPQPCRLILVAGGTASGKTTIVEQAAERLRRPVTIVPQDAYYLDRSRLSPARRRMLNYDEPAAFEWSLLVQHLRALRRGHAIAMPRYSYRTHTRLKRKLRVEPANVVIVDGLFPYWHARCRRLADLLVFVDLDADLRLIRRLERDRRTRGRNVDAVVRQYVDTVRPMHERYVEPCRRWADLTLWGDDAAKAARQLVRAIRELPG